MSEPIQSVSNGSSSVVTERVALTDLADEMGCYKSSLHRIAKRLGIQPIQRRDSERRNQLVATVTAAEALQIQGEFAIRVKTDGGSDSETEPLVAEDGVFYLVQLEPEHDPGRIKVGFTTDLEGRIRKHRCSAPFGQCLKSWPCRRTWEKAAMDSVTAGLEQLHTEVFRARSVEEALNRGDRFFSVMPGVQLTQENEPEEAL